jgi:hypothetical protein
MLASTATLWVTDSSGRVVSHSEVIQFDGLPAFRPCGRDLVEFFNSTGWALYGQMKGKRS